MWEGTAPNNHDTKEFCRETLILCLQIWSRVGFRAGDEKSHTKSNTESRHAGRRHSLQYLLQIVCCILIESQDLSDRYRAQLQHLAQGFFLVGNGLDALDERGNLLWLQLEALQQRGV